MTLREVLPVAFETTRDVINPPGMYQIAYCRRNATSHCVLAQYLRLAAPAPCISLFLPLPQLTQLSDRDI